MLPGSGAAGRAETASVLEDETPGLKLARAGAVRILLVRGLSEVEGSEDSRKQRA